jgi:serine/threonine protein kinase
MLGSVSNCLDDEELARFVDGDVHASEAERVEAHIADCPTCCGVVAALAREGGSGAGERLTSELPSFLRADAPSTLAPGTRVGRYELVERVGTGATGTVYAAQDPDLSRRVALKLLHPRARGEAWRARLLREARAMARIVHPAVVTVYDVGYHDGQLFIAMEFVAGGTLRDWVSAEPRTWQEVLDVFSRVGDGLGAAHAAGLVHRDFKPENVLVSLDGEVRVTDFGLARPLSTAAFDDPVACAPSESGTLRARLTRTGALVGTPAYMSLEQLEGQPADEHSDLFSFCVALYEALYGERPFSGTTLTSLRAAIRAGRIRPEPVKSGVPAALRRVLLKALGPDRERHYPSLRALLTALDRQREKPLRARVAISALGVGLALTLALAADHARVPRDSEGARSPAPVAAASPARNLVNVATTASPTVSAASSALLVAPATTAGTARAPDSHRQRRRPTLLRSPSLPPPSASSSVPLVGAEPKLGTNDAPILR